MKYLNEIQEYWNARSNGFSSASVEELETESGEWWRGYFKQKISTESAEILDCGTGAGFFAVILSGLGHRVTAVDYSPEMLKRAGASLAGRNLEAELIAMDAQALQFQDNRFDVIVSRNLIWNLEQPECAYSELFRVLKPGGTLILEDGNYYLHLHDRAYAAIHEESKKSRVGDTSHQRHNTDNVDMTIIERIAEHLPLSSRQRPQWDFEQLVRLGFSAVNINVRYADYGENNEQGNDIPGRYPVRFLITAVK